MHPFFFGRFQCYVDRYVCTNFPTDHFRLKAIKHWNIFIWPNIRCEWKYGADTKNSWNCISFVKSLCTAIQKSQFLLSVFGDYSLFICYRWCCCWVCCFCHFPKDFRHCIIANLLAIRLCVALKKNISFGFYRLILISIACIT